MYVEQSGRMREEDKDISWLDVTVGEARCHFRRYPERQRGGGRYESWKDTEVLSFQVPEGSTAAQTINLQIGFGFSLLIFDKLDYGIKRTFQSTLNTGINAGILMVAPLLIMAVVISGMILVAWKGGSKEL